MNIHQKKLAICKRRIFFGGRHTTWDIVARIRKMVIDGTLKVSESKYTDIWVPGQKPFTDPESTSTYVGCIDLTLWHGELEVEVWEGKMMYGERRKKRSTFKLEGDWWLIPELVIALDNVYSLYALEVQRGIEDAEFLARVALMEEKLLKEFNPDEVEGE